MILLNSHLDETDELFTLGAYYPSYDPQFKNDAFSSRLLGIKYRHDSDKDPQDWKQHNKELYVQQFIEQVEPMLASGIAIAVVPPSDPAASISGIQEIAKALAAANGRIDATECLIRFTAIPKLAKGGKRDIEQHLNSVRVEHAEVIWGREVLLLDDIATSGNSLTACRQLLLDMGAARVKCMALGRTTHSQ